MSEEPSDLHFSAGETIIVTKKDGDWWIGTIGDRKGVFPANYVQPKSSTTQVKETLVNSITIDKPSNNQSAEPGDEFITRFAYTSDQPGDLTFDAGQAIVVINKEGDWWTGRIEDREGIFPANYIVPKGGDLPTIIESPPAVAAVSSETAGKTASLTRKPGIKVTFTFVRDPQEWTISDLTDRGSVYISGEIQLYKHLIFFF